MANLASEISANDATGVASVAKVDMKLEIVVIPVSDIDRAKEFYAKLGWRLDADYDNGERLPRDPVHAAWLRVLGHLRQKRHRGGARLRPGPVPDRLRHRGRPRRAARSRRRDQRGVPRRRRRVRGRGRALPVRAAPGQRSGSRASQLPLVRLVQRSGRQRLAVPGDHDAAARARRRHATSFASANDLASAFRRAEAAHGEHEKRTGQRDANWPDWYAAYMIAEQAGKELPQ